MRRQKLSSNWNNNQIDLQILNHWLDQ